MNDCCRMTGNEPKIGWLISYDYSLKGLPHFLIIPLSPQEIFNDYIIDYNEGLITFGHLAAFAKIFRYGIQALQDRTLFL